MKKTSILISIILVISTFIIIKSLDVGKDVLVVEKKLDKLPTIISGMQSSDILLEEAIVKELDPDVYIFRDYTSDNGRVINVYIGYYGTKKGGRTGHNPKACYPSSGWAILNDKKETIDIGNGKKITVNAMLVKKDNKNQLVYHWYQSDRTHVFESGIQQNINRFKKMIVNNRDDGAFIRVSMDTDKSEQETKIEIENFIRQLFWLISEYWPEEKDNN
jgi:EpsI family protein